MTSINPIHSAGVIQPARTTGSASSAKPAPQTSSQPADTVEISLQAKVASQLANVPPIRADLVARVKAEIQAGTYETPEKLNAALDGLLKEL